MRTNRNSINSRQRFIASVLVLILLLANLTALNVSVVSFAENNDSYWIQTGVFKFEENAQELTVRLEAAGQNVVWSGTGFITVYVGPFDSYNQANKVLKELKDKKFEGFILQDQVKEVAPSIEVIEPKNIGEVVDETLLNNNKNYFVGSDIRMEGVVGSHSIFVPIDEHWKVKDNAYIEIFYTTSVISEYDFSSMTVYVNNSPIESFWINDKVAGQKHLTIPLPKEKLTTGFNNVSFVSYHRLTDNICEDDANSANWILLGKETRVHIEYEELFDNDDLLDFPYPFIKTSRDLPLDFVLTLADEPRKADVQASLMLSAYTGLINRFTNVNYQIKSFEETSKKLNNLIFIGSIESIPNELKDVFTTDELQRMELEAIVKKVISPYNSTRRILMIVSDDEKSVIEAVKALTRNEMVSQMDKSTQWFSMESAITEPEENENDYMDLRSLGYGHILFEGRKRGSASAFINVPPTWVVTDEAKILIKFKYSDIIQYEKSSISVFINNVPVGSKVFDADHVQDDTLILPIPEEVRQDQTYEVRFVMSLIPKNYDCQSASFDKNLWGFISNETVLFLPHEERSQYSFSRYPAPFVRNGKLNDLTIVFPDNVNTKMIQHASEVLTYVGRDLNEIGEIEYISASEFNESYFDRNLITFGIMEENGFLEQINDNLNVPFNKLLNKFDVNSKIELIDVFGINVGSIQLLQSPFSENRMILAVTGVTNDSIGFSTKYLSDLELFNRLRGDTAFISGSGAIRSEFVGAKASDFESVESEQFLDGRDSDLQRKLSSREIQQFVIAVVSIFIVVILSVIIAARARHKDEHGS